MVSIVIYGETENAELLQRISKDVVAKVGDERSDITILNSDNDSTMPDKDNIDFAFVDITLDNGLEFAKGLRKKYTTIEIIIIADTTISPVMYLTPDIRAATLFLKPLNMQNVENGIEPIFQLLNTKSDDDEKYFIIKDREDKVRIPYSKILYLESRNKRIYVRAQNKEYGMYGILDSLEKTMPEDFKRCHRSFIVNISYIIKIKYAKNLMILKEDIEIPLSRSYKADFKEVVRNEE